MPTTTLRSLCLLVVLLASGVSALPAATPPLDEARVPVPDQSAAARAEALPEALGRVLQRLTGDPDIAGRDAVGPLLADPGRFVQQFSYTTRPMEQPERERQDAPDETVLVPPEAPGETAEPDRGPLLVVQFDTGALREALVRAGVRVWQSQRPPVLVWLAFDSPERRTLVGAEEAAGLRDALVEAVQAYGIPVTFPLLDLADQRQVRFTDVAGGFSRPVIEASERYATPLVLLGSLRGGERRWRGRWQLYVDDLERQWESVDPDRDAALAELAEGLARYLRAEYAVLPDLDASRTFSIRVGGVDDLARFARAERLLQGLPGITAVVVEHVRGDEVRFRLTVNVEVERALRALDRNPAFTAVPSGQLGPEVTPSPSDPVTAANLPAYRLLR